MNLERDHAVVRELFRDLKKVLNDTELSNIFEKLKSLKNFYPEELSYPSHCLVSHIFWELEEKSRID
jgi:hypothetical protein